MVKLDGYYSIAESEIEAILRQKKDRGFPYILTVKTKSEHDYSVGYRDQRSRDNMAYAIESKMNTYNTERKPSLDILRWIVQNENDKLRPYLCRIEKALKEMKPNE